MFVFSIIFISPLSTLPRKQVCGLMRLQTITPSIDAASRLM